MLVGLVTVASCGLRAAFPALRLASVPVLRAFYRDGHERFFDNNAVTMCFDYSAGEQNRNEDTNQNERSEHVCLPC